jgi:RNA polymerase sigma-70 factor (ECF subfamily)
MTPNEENDLIEQTQSGDSAAFGQLYEYHFDWIFKFIRSRVFNKDNVSDLVQEVFLRAYQNIGKYDGSSPFRAWLTGIVKNTLRDYFRKRKKNQNQEKLALFYTDPSESFTMTETDRQLDAGQLVDQIFSQLNPSYQDVLKMRLMEGKSTGEAAIIMYGEDTEEARRKVSSQLYKALISARQIALTLRETTGK